jgi:hypothetical protein
MKRPSDPVVAAVGQTGSFVEVAFLPFSVPHGGFRPAWAERGKRRRQWDSLTLIERRVAIRLLGFQLPHQLHGGCQRRATLADVRKYRRSCLKKLGFSSPTELVGFHREFRQKFERKVWVERGKSES